MAIVKIMDGKETIFTGEYEYTEGGKNEEGIPEFHISASDRKKGYNYREIHLLFNSKKEFEEFLESLIKLKD